MMEDLSKTFLQNVLPPEWVIHHYRPDYGIDLIVELFEFVDEERTISETLAEMFFVQLKSVEKSQVHKIKVHPRYNVEKLPRSTVTTQYREIEVLKLDIDVSELLTVQAMGAAIPVLLILVTIDTRKVYFVCLNDLIDKVILPADPEFHVKQTKTIEIPIKNQITTLRDHLAALRFYAKRPKLYAAFSKFAYQRKELTYTRDVEILRHFLKIIARYDFWKNTPEWTVIAEMYDRIRAVETFTDKDGSSISPAVKEERSTSELRGLADRMKVVGSKKLRREWAEGDLETQEFIWATFVFPVWDALVNMNNMYEEICREWFLPSYLAAIMSYPEESEKAQ